MEPTNHQTSTYALWQKWAKALERQLERIAEIYEAHDEGAPAQKLKDYIERQKLFIDPVAHAQELARRNYDVKGNVSKLYILSLVSLQLLFREALAFFPQVSEDMQRILNSPCYGNCNGRTASDVFKGPHGTQNEGIGSGVPDERGGLPWILFQLLEAAEIGGEDYFHRGLDIKPDGAAPPPEEESDHAERHDVPRSRSRIVTGGGIG